jgi:hypothetical protein
VVLHLEHRGSKRRRLRSRCIPGRLRRSTRCRGRPASCSSSCYCRAAAGRALSAAGCTDHHTTRRLYLSACSSQTKWDAPAAAPPAFLERRMCGQRTEPSRGLIVQSGLDCSLAQTPPRRRPFLERSAAIFNDDQCRDDHGLRRAKIPKSS